MTSQLDSTIPKSLTDICLEALMLSKQVHDDLGVSGTSEVQKNKYGETSLRGDISAEQAIIDTLKKYQVPIRLISEEHGQIDIVENPTLLGVLDGIDGTYNYKSGFNKQGTNDKRYGTMFSIFSNLDPTYNDYVFGGIMEHNLNNLLYAEKGRGAKIITPQGSSDLKTSKREEFSLDTKIHTIKSFDKYAKSDVMANSFFSKLKQYVMQDEHSSAVHYANLLQGTSDLVLEATRKGNLELATAFALINEAGGAIVTPDGESITNKKYLTFGQREYVPTIASATPELARQVIDVLTMK